MFTRILTSSAPFLGALVLLGAPSSAEAARSESVLETMAAAPCKVVVETYENRQWAADRYKALNESTCIVWVRMETGANGVITITYLESCSG